MRLRLPRSLLSRNIALLVALVALSQVCSLAVLLHFVQRPRIERASIIFADYVKLLDTTLASMPPDEGRAAAARLAAHKALPPTLETPAETHPSLVDFFRTWQRDVFVEALQRHLPPELLVRWDASHDAPAAAGAAAQERLWIRLHAAGEPVWIALPMTADARASGITTALILSAVLALLAALTGYLLQRHINRPLRQLARAARRVSAGETPPPLPTDGPTEIAQVSRAFNQMTEGLKQAEATRALMLAGVSHDIRTPLTKLRLAIAMALPRGSNDALVASSESYLDQIDTILQQFMDYAGSGEREAPQAGNLNALAGQLVADFAGLGHEFEFDEGELPVFAFRPIAVMRLLMNLMQNAVNYGRTGLTIRTWRDGDTACVIVADRGNGIRAEELERLKSPFSRGANARTHSGGSGLGLAIVERIARLHGGSLTFRDREGGGLEAVVRLPLTLSSSSRNGAPPAAHA
ncbi:two-component system osmolarity sensor histidine kinase EnvZ [Paraburkholderia silvatlantica]|uniref:histidine kinase n=1 Tax=Paraburkholderia silvatlantica TaxID=321895 RepID=A0A2V4UV97_9BURK|nr:ATP-binding protein [Paraburkholderia silvatlantica]PYE28097.1 two-component system osmolarity sensor histidine kinase EnvZ [Paraburkholderia silvatlantica]